MEIWDIVKAILQFGIIPLLGVVWVFMQKYLKRVDVVEKDVQNLKIRTAVIESVVKDIRDDIHDIKRNVEKLVDRK